MDGFCIRRRNSKGHLAPLQYCADWNPPARQRAASARLTVLRATCSRISAKERTASAACLPPPANTRRSAPARAATAPKRAQEGRRCLTCVKGRTASVAFLSVKCPTDVSCSAVGGYCAKSCCEGAELSDRCGDDGCVCCIPPRECGIV
ncbi:hypothetical protein E2C01_012499 [Portunus trituberculatus]|uniref:Uncharacterized protein n=1 Tax=Portunus trituberculatus TaxID=210409 RepID=A0A5B7DDT9_PORTR|nr:hypothetical protein [Portunus trituberculatus]